MKNTSSTHNRMASKPFTISTWQKIALFSIALNNTFACASRPYAFNKEPKQHQISSEREDVASTASTDQVQPKTIEDNLQIPTSQEQEKHRPVFVRAKNAKKYAFVNETSAGGNVTLKNKNQTVSKDIFRKTTPDLETWFLNVLKLPSIPKILINTVIGSSSLRVFCFFDDRTAVKLLSEHEGELRQAFAKQCYAENSGDTTEKLEYAVSQKIRAGSFLSIEQCTLDSSPVCNTVKVELRKDAVNTTTAIDGCTVERVFYNVRTPIDMPNYGRLSHSLEIPPSNTVTGYTPTPLFEMFDTPALNADLLSGLHDLSSFRIATLFNKLKSMLQLYVPFVDYYEISYDKEPTTTGDDCSIKAKTILRIKFDFLIAVQIKNQITGSWGPLDNGIQWEVVDSIEAGSTPPKVDLHSFIKENVRTVNHITSDMAISTLTNLYDAAALGILEVKKIPQLDSPNSDFLKRGCFLYEVISMYGKAIRELAAECATNEAENAAENAAGKVEIVKKYIESVSVNTTFAAAESDVKKVADDVAEALNEINKAKIIVDRNGRPGQQQEVELKLSEVTHVQKEVTKALKDIREKLSKPEKDELLQNN